MIRVVKHFEAASGVQFNWDKFHIEGQPSLVKDLLGVEFLTELNCRRYPADKRAHLSQVLIDWSQRTLARDNELLSLLMRLMWFAMTSYYVRYKLNAGFRLLRLGKRVRGRVVLDPPFFRMISWMQAVLEIWQPVCMHWQDEWMKGASLGWSSDASGAGFGGALFMHGKWFVFCGTWSDIELTWLDINHLELAAILFASAAFGYLMHHSRTVVETDSANALLAINVGKGRAGMPVLLDSCQLQWTRWSMLVRARHLKGTDNTLSDALSRQKWSIVDKCVAGYPIVSLTVPSATQDLSAVIAAAKSERLAIKEKVTTGGVTSRPILPSDRM